MNNKDFGFPDPDGNKIKSNNNDMIFTSETHIIPLKYHKSYAKNYIYFNYANKKEIFL